MNNHLRYLPLEVIECPHLQRLLLDRNHLTWLPKQLCRMKSLVELSVAGNDLIMLPLGSKHLSYLSLIHHCWSFVVHNIQGDMFVCITWKASLIIKVEIFDEFLLFAHLVYSLNFRFGTHSYFKDCICWQQQMPSCTATVPSKPRDWLQQVSIFCSSRNEQCNLVFWLIKNFRLLVFRWFTRIPLDLLLNFFNDQYGVDNVLTVTIYTAIYLVKICASSCTNRGLYVLFR